MNERVLKILKLDKGITLIAFGISTKCLQFI